MYMYTSWEMSFIFVVLLLQAREIVHSTVRSVGLSNKNLKFMFFEFKLRKAARLAGKSKHW